jgi:cytochrome c
MILRSIGLSLAMLPLSIVMATPALAAGNAQAGAALVKARCQACHVVAKGAKPTVAPNLNGVAGRKAGSSDFANYSPALKASGITWTAAKLDTFLQGPAKLVPGTKMFMTVPDAAQRADVVAFLVGNK